MRNMIEAHNRVKDFDWQASYVLPPKTYPTKYKIPKKTKDPFRHLLRDYLSMEQEKDDRQYGALEDVLARTQQSTQVEPRWLEVMKPVLSIIDFGEYAAMKTCGNLIDTIDNAELRQGYMAQMLDELRHTNQEAYLLRYFARYAKDPEGFAQAMRLRGANPFTRAGRSILELMFTGDPIEGALNLQVVTETGYTNALFVTLTEVAANNGDQATPSVFLSIQSDEARHIANGYATLAAVVAEPDNLKYLQADFDRAFWRQHGFLDAFLGVVYDYFQSKRSVCYGEKWEQWIEGDWINGYVAKLAPFGLQVPRWFPQAKERMKWLPHTAAMFVYGSWPLHFWRSDPLTEADMEWFERKYPGWYEHYGAFWEQYRKMCDPGGRTVPFSMFPSMPPLCRVCQMPCIFPRPDISTVRVREYGGKREAFCSDPCEFIFFEDPQRYLGYKTFYELWDGCDLAEYAIRNELLRADGKTLIPQPTVCNDRMWTIDDLRAVRYEIKDPLKEVAA